MSRESSLVKNTAILSLGTFFPKVFAVIITPILTAQLTKAEYGQYDLITTLVALLLPAVTLQISSAAFRFLIDRKHDKYEISRIITNILAFTLVTSLIAVVLYFLFAGRTLGMNGVWVCLYLVIDIFLVTAQQVVRGLGKNVVYSISAIVQSFVNMLVTVVLLSGFGIPNMGLTGVLYAMIASTLLGLIFLVLKGGLLQYLNVKTLSGAMLRELLAYSWPMVPNNLSGWVLRLSDRLVITGVLGIEANAVYAAANKLPYLLTMALNSFYLAWQENASIAVQDQDRSRYYEDMFDRIYRIMLGMTGILIACTPILFPLLIRGGYEDAYVQMPTLYLGMFFSGMASVLGGIYIAFKQTKSVGITTVIAAALNLAVDLLFVKRIGIWAGSISTMIAYLFLLVYRMYDIQKVQKISFKASTLIVGTIILLVMSLLSVQRKVLLDCVNVLCCVALLAVYDRDVAKTVIAAALRRIKHHS